MAAITNSPPAPGGRFLLAYVDLPFLEKLFQSAPDRGLSRVEERWPEVWQNVYRFLQRSARVVIDAEREVVLSNDLLTEYLFGNGQYAHIDFEPGLAERLSNSEELYVDDPFSVFLLENPKLDFEDLRSRTGLLFLCHEDLEEDWPRLFSDHVLDVNDSSPSFQWTNLCPHATPLNSMVVADKYAHAQFHDGSRSESLEQNLGALLDAILPRGPLDDHLHLTLVTDLKPLLKHDIQPSDVWRQLRAFLDSKRPELDFLLTIVGYQESGHKDRFIFTNYGLLTSNDSFSFFSNGSLSKETLLHHLPSSGERSQVIRRRLHRLSELQERRMNQAAWCYGDFQNRLFKCTDLNGDLVSS